MPINMPVNRKESGLDKVLKALQVASGVFQIPVEWQKMKALQQQADTQKQVADLDIAEKQRQGKLATSEADPNSPESEAARQGQSILLNAAVKNKIIGPEDSSVLLRGLMGKPGEADLSAPGDELNETPAVPGLSAQALKSENGTYKLLNDLTKAKIGGEAGAMKFAPLADVKRQQLNQSQNKDAGAVGQEFEKDPIIKLSKMNDNALKKASSILSNPDAPVTAKDLNLAYNDYINAVDSAGKATEGKVHRELPENYAAELADFASRFGELSDLRKNPAAAPLINQLKLRIGEVKEQIDQAVAEQALNIHDSNKFSDNEKVKSVIQDKLKRYNPKAHSQLYGGDEGAQGGDSAGTAPSKSAMPSDLQKAAAEILAKRKKKQ